MKKAGYKKFMLLLILFAGPFVLKAIQPKADKPRVLISTDIGGTDPDDNQSMIHFLMYNDLFDVEGLISSPSYGNGSKDSILAMIDVYEKDYPTLKNHALSLLPPDTLRALCKQGKKRAAPFVGYSTATEGSDWIIHCAQKKSEKPLWLLVWGGLDDLAQALHDAPEIRYNLRVYWIGGPNKKWSTNSYVFIASNFPELYFIEANATYRGFFSNQVDQTNLNNENFYKNYINGAGNMASAFKNYYNGNIKMGDTPSLLYLMQGNADEPNETHWGGSFDHFQYSPRYIFTKATSLADTVKVYSILEFHLQGPEVKLPPDSACFTLSVKAGMGVQKWPGYYLGSGKYVVRYAPKQAEEISYEITSKIKKFPAIKGQLVVKNTWPGSASFFDYELGDNWFTDKSAPEFFDGQWQGAKTVLKYRNDALLDWSERWGWLK